MNQYNIVLAVLFSVLNVSKSDDITGGTYQKNKVVNAGLSKTVDNKGPKMCVKECLQANGCSAVNFDKANLKCELLFNEGTSPATTDKEGYMYTDIHHWQMPHNPCWPTNPCEKLQKCVPTNQNGGFTCVPITVKRVCDEGWTKFNGHCYLFKPDNAMDFISAKDACKNEGGYLVEIDSSDENEWLKTQFKENDYVTTGSWIGLQYNTDDASWVLSSTGEQPSFTYWSPGYPERGNYETAYIWFYDGRNLWYNNNDAPFEYACEK